MLFKDILKSLRISNGITQTELAKRLGVSYVSIQNWESGSKTPSMTSFIAICKLFGVSADYLLGISDYNTVHNFQFTLAERKLIENYRRLDVIGKKAVSSLCRIESLRNDMDSQSGTSMGLNYPVHSGKQIPRYFTPAAAGYSAPIDGTDFDLIPAYSAPVGTDFAVEIQGNSMEPLIFDGDTVYVKRTSELNNGDVGIFCVNGSMYCKQLYKDSEGNLMLVSANPDLKKSNIYISMDSDNTIYTYGKVLLGHNPKLPEYIFENQTD